MEKEKDTYKTIRSTSQCHLTKMRSKFLGFAEPVKDLGEIKDFLLLYKKKYHDARHLCYAYILGPQSDTTFSNDNGEPSGTAGRPILEQLRAYELTNTLLIVVRYFGGIKLGTSGLFSAYKTIAHDTLEQSEIITETVNKCCSISFEYPYLDKVLKIVNETEAKITAKDFQMTCRMTLQIRLSLYEYIKNLLEKIPKLKINE